MNRRDVIPASISLKGPLSLPVGLVTETKCRMNTNIYPGGLKMICANLGVHFLNEVGVWMGRMAHSSERGTTG